MTIPRVSIGLPVFNGENYLRQALDSLRTQTFTDFEVIICDNGSTDATEAICAEFAEADARFRFVRNPANIGPNRNFDRTVEHARGEYFKWVAHDDVIEPEFLERCVEALDARPEAVLCQSLVRIIDSNGDSLAIYDSRLRGADSPDPAVRLLPLVLRPHICTEMFGLMRRQALRRTRGLSDNYHGCDRAMLAELVLLGPFLQLPGTLFHNREHAERSVRAVAPEQRSSFYRRRRKRMQLDTWHVYTDYLNAVRLHINDPATRRRCYVPLVKWWFVNWNTLRLATELLAQVFPPAYGIAKSLRDRFLRHEHPTVHSRR